MYKMIAILCLLPTLACARNESPAAENPAASAAAEPVSSVARPVNGEIEVKVGSTFEPARFEAKAGEPLKIRFVRLDEPSCGDEVVFPALNIRQKLPPKQTTVVSITPQKSGDLAFTCGMNMMEGTIVVQ